MTPPIVVDAGPAATLTLAHAPAGVTPPIIVVACVRGEKMDWLRGRAWEVPT